VFFLLGPPSNHSLVEQEVQKLAGCGNDGRSKQNIHRDIVRMVDHGRLPYPKSVMVPMKTSVAGAWALKDTRFCFKIGIIASTYKDTGRPSKIH